MIGDRVIEPTIIKRFVTLMWGASECVGKNKVIYS